MNTTGRMENFSNNLGIERNQIEQKTIEIVELVSSEDVELCLMKSTLRSKMSKKRRGRREAYRPYYQLSERERNMREEKERMRIVKLRERMRAKGRIMAPYNTTQFLMADHPEDTFELLEKEQNYDFYSSQSDEDYMSKEFNKDYDIGHITHLEKMSKEMLLNEYMRLERKNDDLEGRLGDSKDNDEQTGKRKENLNDGEEHLEEDTMEKSLIFQKEMEYLIMENRRLSNENARMKNRLKLNSEASSSSDSSSSSSSSSSSDSESSDEECNDNK